MLRAFSSGIRRTRTVSRLGTPLTKDLREAEGLRVDPWRARISMRPHQVRPGKRVPRGACNSSPVRVLCLSNARGISGRRTVGSDRQAPETLRRRRHSRQSTGLTIEGQGLYPCDVEFNVFLVDLFVPADPVPSGSLNMVWFHQQRAVLFG